MLVLVVFIVVTIESCYYMLNYSLSPEQERADSAFCFHEQFNTVMGGIPAKLINYE